MNDATPYLYGLLTTAALLALEHLALYERLHAHPLIKFFFGVLAILVGCAVVAWQIGDANGVLAPFAASCGGLVVALGYFIRWIEKRIKEASYTRGWLRGLADNGDIKEERDG